MKLGLIGLAAVILCGCSSGEIPSSTFNDVPSDAGRPNQPDAHHPPPIVDAGMDEEAATTLPPGYDACVTATDKPITTGSQQAQQCLTEHWCVDSLGNSYLRNIWDSCHDMECHWSLACNGGDPKMFCLPQNEQSDVEYADYDCTKAIAMVALKNGQPVSKYVGVDVFSTPPDAGPDAGYDSCVDIYTIGLPWKDNGDMFYLAKDYGGGDNWVCYPTYINFPGLRFYYLSKTPVNPATLFVQQ